MNLGALHIRDKMCVSFGIDEARRDWTVSLRGKKKKSFSRHVSSERFLHVAVVFSSSRYLTFVSKIKVDGITHIQGHKVNTSGRLQLVEAQPGRGTSISATNGERTAVEQRDESHRRGPREAYTACYFCTRMLKIRRSAVEAGQRHSQDRLVSRSLGHDHTGLIREICLGHGGSGNPPGTVAP